MSEVLKPHIERLREIINRGSYEPRAAQWQAFYDGNSRDAALAIVNDLEEQLEAQAAALCRIARVCPKPLLNGNANYLEDAQSAEIHRLCEVSSPASGSES